MIAKTPDIVSVNDSVKSDVAPALLSDEVPKLVKEPEVRVEKPKRTKRVKAEKPQPVTVESLPNHQVGFSHEIAIHNIKAEIRTIKEQLDESPSEAKDPESSLDEVQSESMIKADEIILGLIEDVEVDDNVAFAAINKTGLTLSEAITYGFQFIPDLIKKRLAETVESEGEGLVVIDGSFSTTSTETAKLIESLTSEIVMEANFAHLLENSESRLQPDDKVLLAATESSLVTLIQFAESRDLADKFISAIKDGQLALDEVGEVYSEGDTAELEVSLKAEALEKIRANFEATLVERGLERFRDSDLLYQAAEAYVKKLKEALSKTTKGREIALARPDIIIENTAVFDEIEKHRGKQSDRVERVSVAEHLLGRFVESREQYYKKEAALRADLLIALGSFASGDGDINTEVISRLQEVTSNLDFYDTNYRSRDARRLKEYIGETHISGERSIIHDSTQTLAELVLERFDLEKIYNEAGDVVVTEVEFVLDRKLSDEERESLIQNKQFGRYFRYYLLQKGAIIRLRELAGVDTIDFDARTAGLLAKDVEDSEARMQGILEDLMIEISFAEIIKNFDRLMDEKETYFAPALGHEDLKEIRRQGEIALEKETVISEDRVTGIRQKGARDKFEFTDQEALAESVADEIKIHGQIVDGLIGATSFNRLGNRAEDVIKVLPGVARE